MRGLSRLRGCRRPPFVCSPALAVPPLDGWPGSPRSDPTLDASVQPLPTLVPPPNDAFAAAAVAPSIPFSATQSTAEATTAVDDPARVRRSRPVGAHFGLTPKKYQSGETKVSGGISRIGDPLVRTALCEAAHIMLARTRHGSCA